jgi:hypothetical protein
LGKPTSQMRRLLLLGSIRDLIRRAASRGLKKSASFVLALNRSSTYPRGYACGLFFDCGLAGRPF